jgi:hypothetical protein
MITFKDFLEEALKPSLYRPLVKDWDRKRLEDIFKTSPLEKDRRAFRLYFQFPQEEIKVEPNPVVTSALKDLGYEIDNYKLGLAVKDRRKIKIGRVLSKNPAALKVYMEDPARAGTQKKYEGVISRHPYDIAGMSTDRGWTSCQDLIRDPETACEYVPADIQAGTLIAYMIKTGDRDIKSPVGRILIKPYINTKRETGYGMANISYGTVTDKFKEEVEKFVDWLNKQKKVKGLFQLAPKVYQGTDVSSTALIGDMDESELIQIVSKNADRIKLIKNPSENVQLAAIEKNPLSIKFVKNPSEKVQLAAVIKTPSLITFIENPTEKVQIIAIERGGYSIARIVNPTEKVQIAAVSTNAYSIEFIENPSEKVQLAAIEKNALSINFIENPSEKVQIAAIEKNPFSLKYLKNPTPKVIQLAKELQGK